jgi:hypothetical protein
MRKGVGHAMYVDMPRVGQDFVLLIQSSTALDAVRATVRATVRRSTLSFSTYSHVRP